MRTLEDMTEAFERLERGIHTALETYSNVHRGSGYNSIVTTHLFEKARDIILEYFRLDKGRYVAVFCTQRRAEVLIKQLELRSYKIVSSLDIGLALGVRALAIKRKALPRGTPFQTGGGTTRLISRDWVIWADAPDKFEAGTPAIINIIAFAKALRLIKQYGNDIFLDSKAKKLTINEIVHYDELEEYVGLNLLNELNKTLIGRNINVPTVEDSQPFVNLDNSASTRTFTPVLNTFLQTLSQEKIVQENVIQEVKSICAQKLGAPLSAYDIIFTSNTTEAINLVAENLSLEFDKETGPVILNTILEHSSNDLPWRTVLNHSLVRLPVNDEGFIDLKELETLLYQYNHIGLFEKKRIKLVAISGASNVLGTCNNIAEISRIVHKFGALLLIDAAQLIAHRDIDMETSGIDYLAFSAHKVYAPFGCGVLMVKKGLLKFKPDELRIIQVSGEENAAGIAALGKAFVLLQRIGMEIIAKKEQALTERILKGMSQITGLKIHGIRTRNHPQFDKKLGVIVFGMKGMMADILAKKLVMQSGIGVRYGCHCAHIIIKHLVKVSNGLERFQRLFLTLFPKLSLPGLVRVSMGIENTEEDIDRLIVALKKLERKPKSSPSTKELVLSNAEVKKKITDLIKHLELTVYSN